VLGHVERRDDATVPRVEAGDGDVVSAPRAMEPQPAADRERRATGDRLAIRERTRGVLPHLDIDPPEIEEHSLAPRRGGEPCLIARQEDERPGDRVGER
jgi:hypothetical protein